MPAGSGVRRSKAMSRTYRREPLTIEDVEVIRDPNSDGNYHLSSLTTIERLALAEALQAFVDSPTLPIQRHPGPYRVAWREALEAGAVVVMDELDVRQ